VRTWATIAAAEARYAEAREYEHRLYEMTERAAHFMHFGGRVTAEDYVYAQFERERLHRAYLELFARTGASVLVTPTLGCEAFPHGTNHPLTIGGVDVSALWMDWAPFLYDANLCGYPAASIPIGFGDDGLPIGLQIMGLRARDGAVLAAAELFEAIVGARSWPPDPWAHAAEPDPVQHVEYDAGPAAGSGDEAIASVQ